MFDSPVHIPKLPHNPSLLRAHRQLIQTVTILILCEKRKIPKSVLSPNLNKNLEVKKLMKTLKLMQEQLNSHPIPNKFNG